ncbi:hypothetical protein QEN19_002973 [Hanseniaspora menglaensis]
MKFSFSFSFITAVLLKPIFIASSPGDWYPEQIQCKYHCEERYCLETKPPLDEDVDMNEEPLFVPLQSSITPNFIDSFLLWDCESLCDYKCQQLTTEYLQKKRKMDKSNEKLVQFHGKWPFTRVFYIQEFWSTIFSIGNFIPHFAALRKLNKINASDGKPNLLIKNYKLVAIMGSCAWTFSAIFHFRDILITEKLDYFFAGGTVLSGFYAISMRVVVGGDKRKQKKYGLIGFLICSVIFFAHVLKLYIDWSYTYNMRFNIFFGILQYIMLITVGVNNYFKYRNSKYLNVFKLSATPVLLVLFTGASMSFELFDIFIPQLQLDSHAIWHGLTIWPSFKLYEFFIEDFIALSKNDNRSEKAQFPKRLL